MKLKLPSAREVLTDAFVCFQMEVIVGDFGIVVVPRDGVDTERIMNHSSVLRKYKVSTQYVINTTQRRGKHSEACGGYINLPSDK